MTNSKRILFISEFAGFIGGTEKYIFSVAQLLKSKGFICDMDGVIYHGNKILPGVVEFIKWLQEEKKEFLEE